MLGKITIKLFQRVNDGKEAIVRIDELELMAKRMRRLAIGRINMSLVPYVVEQTSRGERSYDIFSMPGFSGKLY